MTAVRTGPKSLTMMLIERDADTVDTRKIKTSYSPSAGTAYVFFEKTKVPVENVLGGEGNGLKVILSNCASRSSFPLPQVPWADVGAVTLAVNHERWVINCRIARYSRLVFEETWKWAHLRKSQGKRLIDNAVVRQKFGQMIARIDSGQAWLEHLTYQMCVSPVLKRRAFANPS